MRAAWAAGLAALACAAVVIAATPKDAYWIADCGAKALIAKRLLQTHFTAIAFDRPAAALDPTGEAFPIPAPFAVRVGDDFVSQYPPAYPALAAPFRALWGPAGLRVPAALGLGLCAVLFALWTAPVFGAVRAAWGGLALALATPLFFYGVTVWEHALTVAALLGAVVALAERTPRRLALAGALVALAGCLREELFLALPAIAIASFWRDRTPSDVLWIGAGAAPLAAGLAWLNAQLYGDPLGVHVGANLHALPPPSQMLRTAGALFAGMGARPAEGVALAGGVGLAWALGGAGAARERLRDVGLVLAAVAGLAVWLRGAAGIALADVPFGALPRYNGFAVQLPLVALAGAGAVRVLRDPALAPLRPGIVAGLLFLLFFLPFRITVSDPAIGGHWGPRMLLPAAPALVALAFAATTAPAASHRARRGVLALLCAAGLASTALSVSLLDAQKREARALQQRIAAMPQAVWVTTNPAIGQQLAELWGRRPLLLARDGDHLARISRGLARDGVDEFLLIWRPGRRDVVPRLPGARCTPAGRHTGVHVRRYFDAAFYACATRGGDSSAR